MKVKVKLDVKTLQELLLQNVEKIGLGVVALIFLLMVYSAFNKVDRYDRTPEQLIQAVQQGETTIEGTPPETDLKVQDYASLAERSRIPIKEKEYVTDRPWDNRLFATRSLRGAPPLLAAHQLRGKADVGAFQMIATPEENAAGRANPIGEGMFPGGPRPTMTGSANEVRGQRWIVLTALVPIEKQELAFIEAFRSSKFFDPQNDVPRYLGYWIERVEVAGPSEAANIDWKKARKIQSNKAMKEAMSKWSQSGGTEVVEQKYLHERLVFPLAPLVGSQWDENVAHPEEIPILSTGAMGMGMGMGMGRGMPSGRGVMGEEFLGGGMGRRGGMPGRMGPRGFGRPGGMPNAEDDPFNTERNNPLGTDTADAQRIAEQNKPPSNLLLRFFDFNVEPGKQYVYRVRLGLHNPNRNLKPIYLADPELAEQKWLETKWSDPSPVVSVPRDTRVLAVSVSQGRANRDPTGRVMLAKWVQRRGFLAHDEFNVERGQTLNFPDKKFRRVEDGNRMRGAMGRMMPPNPMGLEGLGGMPPGAGRTPAVRRGTGRRNEPRDPRRGPRGMEDMRHPEMPFGEMGRMPTPTVAGKEWLVNYYSRAIAIDFRGGENLSDRRGSGLTSLGEILLLDAEGNLVVHNELDDRPDRDKITAASEATSPAAGGTLQNPVPNMPHPKGALDKLFMPGPTRKKPGRR